MQPFAVDSSGARRLAVGTCLALSALLVACGGGGGSDDSGSNNGTAGGRITGTAVNATTGGPIAGATVTVGAASATTDANGAFTLSNAGVGERLVVRATAQGYAPNFETTSVSTSAAGSVQLTLVPEYKLNLYATSGGAVSDATTGARVTLAPNSLALANGSAYTGTVTVQLATIAPATNLSAMPGELLAATASGTEAIESFGALSVVLTGSAGEAVNLAAGKTATVRIPVSSRTPVASLPATVPLYFFNETTGLWVSEGTAALAADKSYYEGSVSHFTVWNADRALDTITYKGCLKDAAGNRVAGATVYSEGIDYSGSSRATSGANGVFTIPMKKSGQATILGVSGSLFTNTVSAGPSATDIDVSGSDANCLTFGAVTGSLSIKLTWGQSPSDVDSHLYFPNGSHVYFSNEGSLVADPFAALDVDDTDSFGPEVITVRKLMVGTYLYGLKNYSRSTEPGMTDSPVRVELIRNGTSQFFAPTAGETTSTFWWSVFRLTVNESCNVTVTPVGTWDLDEPIESAPTTPVYCTP